MKRKRYGWLMALLLAWTPLGAQETSGIVGAFADVGIGARAQALGGAYTAIVQQVNTMFWNPAGLAGIQSIGVDFSYARQFGLIPYSAFSGAVPLGQAHVLGVGVLASGDEQLRETTILATYAINPEDWLPDFLTGLQAGVSLKYHLANFGKNGFDPNAFPLFSPQDLAAAEAAFVQGTASGIGVDVGLTYRVSTRVFLGMSVRNFISSISWNNGQESYSEGVPTRVAFGLAYYSQGGLLVTADYESTGGSESPNRFRFGTEKVLFKLLALRGGVGQTLSAENQRDYTLGMGLLKTLSGFGRLSVDYAYQMNPIGNSHRFSVGFRF
ncbi:MAG: hypothetical protein Q9P90_13915 [candidate division KSB1 bacterium]|nr:hypothetical protein [candidate division KSB1 bacterium]